MQTWITDYDFYTSACNLDKQRLHANIYESIQILASLLDCTDKLVNPKRNVKNYPQAKLWRTYERILMGYIQDHVRVWLQSSKSSFDNIISTVTWRNLFILLSYILNTKLSYGYPSWITDELIITHRSILIQKKPEHYRKLWTDIPENLKMRYDWQEKYAKNF